MTVPISSSKLSQIFHLQTKETKENQKIAHFMKVFPADAKIASLFLMERANRNNLKFTDFSRAFFALSRLRLRARNC